MDSYDILVIFLSIALGAFLVVHIILGILAIQVMKKVKHTSETAQQAVENVEAFTSQLKQAGRATAVGAILNQVSQLFSKKKERDNE